MFNSFEFDLWKSRVQRTRSLGLRSNTRYFLRLEGPTLQTQSRSQGVLPLPRPTHIHTQPHHRNCTKHPIEHACLQACTRFVRSSDFHPLVAQMDVSGGMAGTRNSGKSGTGGMVEKAGSRGADAPGGSDTPSAIDRWETGPIAARES